MADEVQRDDKGRFMKGQTGNPGGRPKGKGLVTQMLEHLDQLDENVGVVNRELFIQRLWEAILVANIQAMKLWLSYTDGLPKATLDANVKGTTITDSKFIAIKNMLLQIVANDPAQREELLDALDKLDYDAEDGD